MMLGDMEMRERRDRLKRGRTAMPSRPVPIPMRGEPVGLGQASLVPIPVPALGDIKAQGVRMADVLVFGPLMIYSGLGKATPMWVRTGMVIIGVGTILYNLANYMTVEREKIESGLGQMQHGPMHRATADLHRPINLVKQLHPSQVSR